MKPSEIIDKALVEVIPDESRWCQRALCDIHTGQHCAMGALRVAAYGSILQPVLIDHENGAYHEIAYHEMSNVSAAIQEIERCIEACTGLDWPLFSFNDTHTYPEVREMMEKARAGLQEEGQ